MKIHEKPACRWANTVIAVTLVLAVVRAPKLAAASCASDVSALQIDAKFSPAMLSYYLVSR